MPQPSVFVKNAPRACPNSSDSIRWSEMAPHSAGTKGPEPRAELACTARAASSFPVPFSPVISTVASVAEARTSASKTCCMAALLPISPSSFSSAADEGREAAGPLAQRLSLGGAHDRHQRFVGLERLAQVVVGAFLHGVHRPRHRFVHGHQDDLEVWFGPLELAQKLDPVHAGNADVRRWSHSAVMPGIARKVTTAPLSSVVGSFRPSPGSVSGATLAMSSRCTNGLMSRAPMPLHETASVSRRLADARRGDDAPRPGDRGSQSGCARRSNTRRCSWWRRRSAGTPSNARRFRAAFDRTPPRAGRPVAGAPGRPARGSPAQHESSERQAELDE